MSVFLSIKKYVLFGFVLLSACALGYGAMAQEAATAQPPVDVLPAATTAEHEIAYDDTSHTHPPVKLTPDKSELIRLDRPAGSIIVGNPNHLSVLADTSKTLVLVARAPGATHFTVLDQKGAVLMQRHVIVASPKKNYLRIRRSCAGEDEEACQRTSVFYCPDMCHEVVVGGVENDDGAEATDEEDQGNGPEGSPEADESAETGED